MNFKVGDNVILTKSQNKEDFGLIGHVAKITKISMHRYEEILKILNGRKFLFCEKWVESLNKPIIIEFKNIFRIFVCDKDETKYEVGNSENFNKNKNNYLLKYKDSQITDNYKNSFTIQGKDDSIDLYISGQKYAWISVFPDQIKKSKTYDEEEL